MFAALRLRAQVGVSIEPLAEVAAKESSRVGDKLAYAKRVGMDLYHFLASFATQTNGDTIVIPTKALDRCVWAIQGGRDGVERCWWGLGGHVLLVCGQYGLGREQPLPGPGPSEGMAWLAALCWMSSSYQA